MSEGPRVTELDAWRDWHWLSKHRHCQVKAAHWIFVVADGRSRGLVGRTWDLCCRVQMVVCVASQLSAFSISVRNIMLIANIYGERAD